MSWLPRAVYEETIANPHIGRHRVRAKSIYRQRRFNIANFVPALGSIGAKAITNGFNYLSNMAPYNTPKSSSKSRGKRPASRSVSRGRSVTRSRSAIAGPSTSKAASRPPSYRASSNRSLSRVSSFGWMNRLTAPKRAVRFNTTGSSGGRFRRTTRRTANTQLSYQKKGCCHVQEIHGTISDPNCVYIAHMSFDQISMIKLALQSMFRKLFDDVADIKLDSPDQKIPGQTSFDGDNTWNVKLIGQYSSNGTTAVIQSTNTSSTETLATLAGSFLDQFVKFSSGYTTTLATGNDGNTLEFTNLQLFYRDNGGLSGLAEKLMFKGELAIRDLTLHYFGKSALKIQNRTLSSIGDNDQDAVDNNPLIGYMYDFKGIPKSANVSLKNLEKFEAVTTHFGVALTRAADMSGQVGGSNYAEPPLPRQWKNCVKASRIKLEPGSIKVGYCSVYKVKNFVQWLKKLRYQASNSIAVSWGNMPCQLIALEDMINVNAENNINVAYEVNRDMGCYMTIKSKAHIMQQTYETNSYAV